MHGVIMTSRCDMTAGPVSHRPVSQRSGRIGRRCIGRHCIGGRYIGRRYIGKRVCLSSFSSGVAVMSDRT